VFFVVFVVGACLAALAGNGGGTEGEKNKKSGGGKDSAPKPALVVSSPSGSPTVTKDSIEVKGKVTPANSKVTVNGEGVIPDDDGSFSTPFHLNVGENYIQITAVKGSEQADASRTVTRKLSEKEIAAQGAAEEKAKKGEPQVQKNEEQPQAEQKPIPKPEPRPKPEYRVRPQSGACRDVDTFTGSGETRTDTPFFTIVGPHWRVVYESVNTAPPPVEGMLGFFIRNERGDLLDPNGVAVEGDNSGIKNVISDPGQYYIQIITAEVDWTIRVEDCGNTTT